MRKFHVNKNGEIKPCRADKTVCRFGAENHYSTQQEAEHALSQKHSNEPMTKTKRRTMPNNGVEQLAASGLESTTIKSIREHKFASTKDPYTNSSIDVIPENNAKKLLEDIMAGKVTAFA